MIFMTRDIERKITAGAVRCIFPDTIGKYEFSGSLTDKEENFDSEACAEIIFTSGSTGVPKVVMISHKNLIANTESIVTYLKLDQEDRMLVVLPFYYCYGLSLLHTHLRVGGSIVLNNSFIFLGSIINNLLEYKCTGFAGVPSHFQILLRKSDNFKTTKFPDLKYVTQAGGKLAPIFIDEFRNSHPEITFIVMYGQTEATARLSYLPPELYEDKKGSMGKGIPGVELKVINEKGEKIKPGEIGEVIARGDNVMLGYFKDEEGTKNAIRDGWLYTGDLGTVDKDGYIFLTARKKEIIKVGGKRISPKEIEAVILELPEVVDCTIEGVEDELLGEALKAIVVIRAENGKETMIDKIKQHCSRHLALYKVPQIIELKEQLVISATGKKIKGKL
jgi:acyl-CoA synthetase (AMP-forming)/AMP-acid ligase II